MRKIKIKFKGGFMKFLNNSKDEYIDKGCPKIFRYLKERK